MAPSRRLASPLLSWVLLALAGPLSAALAQTAAPTCAADRGAPLPPADPARCAELESVVRQPRALPLDEYEAKLGEYLRGFCHRNAEAGWRRDKGVRDTGPYIAILSEGQWVGAYYGTHAPVLVWYSPEMAGWLQANRPAAAPPTAPAPVPDGAIVVKEMYPAPAAACAGADPLHLLPSSGAAVMVRDSGASHDGWFWGWFGWSGWTPDWPADGQNRYPYMGFGQYCVNCHASAADNLTFASLRNMDGEPGQPLVFLSQHFAAPRPPAPHHRLVALPGDDAPRLGQPLYAYNPAVTALAAAPGGAAPSWDTITGLPSQTYDNVWARAGGPSAASQFLTSDQCLGCHDAGGTGLQFDMILSNPHGVNLLNLSPYGAWRSSPMGLAGRDPIFFAQLASETETFHPDQAGQVQDICLGHGHQPHRPQAALRGGLPAGVHRIPGAGRRGPGAMSTARAGPSTGNCGGRPIAAPGWNPTPWCTSPITSASAARTRRRSIRNWSPARPTWNSRPAATSPPPAASSAPVSCPSAAT